VKTKHWITLGMAAAGTGMFYAIRRYHHQLFDAYRRISSGSRLIETPKGVLEYAEAGKGPAVLVSAGMGGYDLGLQFAWPESGFRFLSVSRPGYLRTPLYTGRNFEEQADAFAALLDRLDIDQVALVGISSGGPAAIQFALRHPDRCWALVLISSPNQPLPASMAITRIFNSQVLSSDFLSWLIFKPVVSKYYLQSAERELIEQDSEKNRMFSAIAKTLFPLSFRRDGIANDLQVIQEMPLYPIDLIQVPTLVIHGDRDEIVPYKHGEWSAGRIRQALFLAVEGGGHLSFITHLKITRQAMLTFLKYRAPEEVNHDLSQADTSSGYSS
jgi:pimeloyl-ACP methyl ester carboxylesterase